MNELETQIGLNTINDSKRGFITKSALALFSLLTPSLFFAKTSSKSAKGRLMHFKSVNTGEKLAVFYKPGRGFSQKDTIKLRYLLRDRRTQLQHNIDNKLYDKIFHLQNSLKAQNKEILIICGYRAPKTNKMMRAHSKGVAKNSYHINGQAIDLRIDGVSLSTLRRVALKTTHGGVGYYPRSNFVHLDTGPKRNWRGS